MADTVGAEELAEDFDQTLTVTLELDDDFVRISSAEEVPDFFDFHIDQPSTSDLLVTVDPDILIYQAPEPIVRVLQLRLNAPAMGSMRNWEYVAMLLGLSLDEITLFRTSDNPMKRVLDAYREVALNALLAAIADAGRADVLISLRPHLRHIKAGGALAKKPPMKERKPHLEVLFEYFMKSLKPGALENGAPLFVSNHPLPGPSKPLRQMPPKFILVTHHEEPRPAKGRGSSAAAMTATLSPSNGRSGTLDSTTTTIDSAVSLPSGNRGGRAGASSSADAQQQLRAPSERQRFKHLWVNLKNWSDQSDIALFDINKCVDEENTIASLYEYFARATQIVMVCSRAYHEDVCSPQARESGDATLELKRRLHAFMEQEFHRNDAQNYRFRVIIFDASDKAYIPVGWASSTIYYIFPRQHKEIAKKLFDVK